MKLKKESKENYELFTEDVAGEIELEWQLKNIEGSCIIQWNGELSDEVITVLQDARTEIEEGYHLLVFVQNEGLKKTIEELNSEFIVYLPTLHEAEEAIMMNELEKQFRAEMGEE